MPEIFSQTPYLVEVVPLIDKEGHTVAVVVAKGTYQYDDQKQALVWADEQESIRFADEYVGEPGKSPIRIPSDLVYTKPATDVIVVRPSADTDASAWVGRKIAIEIGPVRFSGRLTTQWESGPLRYDEKPRKSYAGTYDAAWTENRMPLLPLDFDARFNQAAPPSQTASGYLNGSEHVKIANLYQDGETVEFDLPGRVILVAGNVRDRYFTEVAALDTVLIWPEKPRITLVWRQAVVPRQKFEEVSNIYVYLVRLRTARELYGKP